LAAWIHCGIWAYDVASDQGCQRSETGPFLCEQLKMNPIKPIGRGSK
jgi:hypothetical protein